MCRAQVGADDVDANSRVLRDDDWARDARFGHDDVRPALGLDGEAVGSAYAHLNAPLSGLELRHRRQGEQEYAPCAACPVQVIPGSGPARIRSPSAPDRVDRADSRTRGTTPVPRRDCEPRRLRLVLGCRHPAPGSKRCSPHYLGGSLPLDAGQGRPAGGGTSRRWCEPRHGTSAWSGPAAAPGAGSGRSRSRTRRPRAGLLVWVLSSPVVRRRPRHPHRRGGVAVEPGDRRGRAGCHTP